MNADQPFENVRAAYEGLESSSGFGASGELDRYRRAALEKTGDQAKFIAARLPEGRAVEIGCGNGRLLLALRKAGVIDRGLGLDIAASRIDFARTWAADAGVDGLDFQTADALSYELEPASFQAAICITGAFGYFDAYAPGSAAQLLRRLHDALDFGGLLVLELYQHPVERRLLGAAGNEVRTWTELPQADPWQFYLSHLLLDGNVLIHHKTFIHRTENIVDEGRSERLALYATADIAAMVEAEGFTDVELREGWTKVRYADGPCLVVEARRA